MNKKDSLSKSSTKRHESFTLSGNSVHLEKWAVIGDELAEAISTLSVVDGGGKMTRETCTCIVELDVRAEIYLFLQGEELHHQQCGDVVYVCVCCQELRSHPITPQKHEGHFALSLGMARQLHDSTVVVQRQANHKTT